MSQSVVTAADARAKLAEEASPPPGRKKRKLNRLSYLCSLIDGKLTLAEATRRRMTEELKQFEDEPNARIIIEREANPKTHAQLRAFYGPIIEQLQAFYMAYDGTYKSPDRIKADLKDRFLPKVKQYYDDGSPVMIRVPHPEKHGVFYNWHLELVPSLADLNIDQASSFIQEILDHFLHDRGWQIELDPSKASQRYRK